MNMNEKHSFFDRLTGTVHAEEEKTLEVSSEDKNAEEEKENLMPDEDGELQVDVYQTPDEIIIKAMIAGVHPDKLQVTITRDMVTIKGSRKEDERIQENDYYHHELYWGSFSRTILLPQEIEPDEAKASEKHGLLTISLPKIDRKKVSKLKVKSG